MQSMQQLSNQPSSQHISLGERLYQYQYHTLEAWKHKQRPTWSCYHRDLNQMGTSPSSNATTFFKKSRSPLPTLDLYYSKFSFILTFSMNLRRFSRAVGQTSTKENSSKLAPFQYYVLCPCRRLNTRNEHTLIGRASSLKSISLWRERALEWHAAYSLDPSSSLVASHLPSAQGEETSWNNNLFL